MPLSFNQIIVAMSPPVCMPDHYHNSSHSRHLLPGYSLSFLSQQTPSSPKYLFVSPRRRFVEDWPTPLNEAMFAMGISNFNLNIFSVDCMLGNYTTKYIFRLLLPTGMAAFYLFIFGLAYLHALMVRGELLRYLSV